MAGRQGYLIEFQAIGNSVKVCAIDPESGVEVSIVGPANLSQDQLAHAAVRKLQYVLRKRSQSSPQGLTGGGKRRGLLI